MCSDMSESVGEDDCILGSELEEEMAERPSPTEEQLELDECKFILGQYGAGRHVIC
jgi:hypothetical protein